MGPGGRVLSVVVSVYTASTQPGFQRLQTEAHTPGHTFRQVQFCGKRVKLPFSPPSARKPRHRGSRRAQRTRGVAGGGAGRRRTSPSALAGGTIARARASTHGALALSPVCARPALQARPRTPGPPRGMNGMVMNAPPMVMHAPYPPSWGAVGVFPAPFPVHPFAGFVYPPMFPGPFGHGMPPVAHLPAPAGPIAARAAQQPSAKRQKTKGAQDRGGGAPEGLAAGRKTPLAAAKVSSIDSRANKTARPAAWGQEDDRPSLCFPAWNVNVRTRPCLSRAFAWQVRTQRLKCLRPEN